MLSNNRWDKYRVPNDNLINSSDKWGKYKVNNIPQGDSWPSLIGKSALKGLTSLADLPKLAAQGLEGISNIATRSSYIPGNIYGIANPDFENAPQTNLAEYVPTSEDARKAINKYTGIDLEPHPTTGAQRVVSHAAEFAGGVGPFGMIGKGTGLVNKGIGALKAARTGATIGATSGALQEGGVNPLVADIGSFLAIPAASASTKNILNKFSKSHRDLKTKEKVANALKKQIGEENIPTVLENIQKYKRQKKPINLQPTTPELAQDVGLSRLYRTQSNLESIPGRYKENDIKLQEALRNIGTTGLEESVKGDILREPFIERFAKKKARRTKLTEPLYEDLEAIQEGINPKTARNLLKEEISVASPNVRAPLEKYLKNLNRNEVSELDLNKIKDLNNTLKNIDKEYVNLNPNAVTELKAPILAELKEVESRILPRPIQIENTIQELGDKVNALSRTGENNAARRYGAIKKAYEEDLAQNPGGLKHRTEYARLSKPINEIETSSLLNAFVKENKDVNKLEGFVAPSEKIPQLVLNADLPNTKILINKSKANPDILNAIKGVYIDELLQKSTLSSGNFSYDKANKFLNNKIMKEKIGVIFNQKEKAKLKQFLDTLEKRNKIETMGKVSGSDTHQKLKVDNEFNQSLGNLGKIAEKLAIHNTGTGKLGELLLNTSKDAINRVKNARYNNVLEEALLNPTYFKNLIKEERKPKAFKDFYQPYLIPLGNTILQNKGE